MVKSKIQASRGCSPEFIAAYGKPIQDIMDVIVNKRSPGEGFMDSVNIASCLLANIFCLSTRTGETAREWSISAGQRLATALHNTIAVVEEEFVNGEESNDKPKT